MLLNCVMCYSSTEGRPHPRFPGALADIACRAGRDAFSVAGGWMRYRIRAWIFASTALRDGSDAWLAVEYFCPPFLVKRDVS